MSPPVHLSLVEQRLSGYWRLWLVLLILALSGFGILALRDYLRFDRLSRESEQATNIVQAGETLVSTMVEAETGYRGYLLTRNPSFLDPYRQNVPLVAETLRRLTGLLPDQNLTGLAETVNARMEEMVDVLARFDAGDTGGAIAAVESGRGKLLMDDVRAQTANLIRRYDQRLDTLGAEVESAGGGARLFGFTALTMALALALLGWLLNRHIERRRQEHVAEALARADAERETAEALAKARGHESLTRSILESSPDWMTVLDLDGRVAFVNAAGRRAVPMPRTDADGAHGWHRWRDPWDAENATAVQKAFDAAVTAGEGRCVASRLADGATTWWDVRLALSRSAEGAPLQVVATARDITAQRRSDEERAQLLSSERQARSEAERAARLKDEFVATLSHELRTPLNAILGWTGVLKRDQAPATLQKALDVIDRNSRRQSQMIDDLLDMGRILSGKLRLDIQRTDLAAVIEEAVQSAQPGADAKGVKMRVLLGSAAIVRGDPARLQQVVWNLLSNAIKFTPRGGQVQVTLQKIHSQVQVQVTDSGVGIALDLLPHVFERFRQGEGLPGQRQGGLGLGLSIVKNLVDLHGGTVDVSSDGPGTGATFTFNLPMALAEPRGADGSIASTGPVELGAILSGVRVLVVEDEEDARDVVHRLLEDAGAVVATAGSTVEALTALRGIVPDVLVSDVGMPGQDGYQLMEQVRRLDGPARTVPAVALTALARLEDRRRAMLAGFQSHLSKPVDPTELVATVASLAGRTGYTVQV